MTPIPPSYLFRTAYDQRWVEPDDAPTHPGTPPHGGSRRWTAIVARARRVTTWLGAEASVPTARLLADLREAGR